MRAQHLLDRDAVDELHDDVGLAVVVEGEVVELRDVGVAQPDRDARLLRKRRRISSSASTWGRMTLMTRISSSRRWRTL